VCGFAYTHLLSLRQALPSACVSSLLRHPITRNGLRWYRNFNLLSFDYAFRPRLRSRLTLSGRTFLRNPWAFGGQDSHLSFRYLYRHSHFQTLQLSFRSTFTAVWNAPLPNIAAAIASVAYLAPLHFRRRVTRPVSYYALFKWWLLLSQHPGCLGNSTSFPT
jgi:hypothetical protein